MVNKDEFEIKEVPVDIAVINKQDCKKCLKCKKVCMLKCISEDEDGFPVINENECMGCNVCREVCEHKAITCKKVVQRREIKKIGKFEIW